MSEGRDGAGGCIPLPWPAGDLLLPSRPALPARQVKLVAWDALMFWQSMCVRYKHDLYFAFIASTYMWDGGQAGTPLKNICWPTSLCGLINFPMYGDWQSRLLVLEIGFGRKNGVTYITGEVEFILWQVGISSMMSYSGVSEVQSKRNLLFVDLFGVCTMT